MKMTSNGAFPDVGTRFSVGGDVKMQAKTKNIF